MSTNNQRVKQVIYFCVDVSYSMGELINETDGIQRLTVAKHLIKGFCDLIEDENIPTLFALIKFSNEVAKVLSFTHEINEVYDAAENLKNMKATALLDAVKEAAEDIISIEKEEQNALKRIVVISDGHDNRSSTDIIELKQLLKEHQIRVDCLNIGTDIEQRAQEISNNTGGTFKIINNYNEGIKAIKENHLYKP